MEMASFTDTGGHPYDRIGCSQDSTITSTEDVMCHLSLECKEKQSGREMKGRRQDRKENRRSAVKDTQSREKNHVTRS